MSLKTFTDKSEVYVLIKAGRFPIGKPELANKFGQIVAKLIRGPRHPINKSVHAVVRFPFHLDNADTFTFLDEDIETIKP